MKATLADIAQMYVDWDQIAEHAWEAKWRGLYDELWNHLDPPPAYRFEDLLRDAMAAALASPNHEIEVG